MGPVMKGWYDTPGHLQRRALFVKVLREAGSVTAAAKVLGISRRHATRLKETLRLSETRETTETSSVVKMAHGQETPTTLEPLTYGATVRSFKPVATAPTLTQDEIVRTAVDLPRSWLVWLEQEALRRKQRGESRWLSKSPVVVEALEMLREKLEPQPKSKLAAKAKGEK